MKRTSTRAASVVAVAATISMGASSLGYAGETEAPSYPEFTSATYQDPTDQQYIVNQVYGTDDVWSARQAQDFTHCVSTDFSAGHSAIVDAIEAGGNQWEGATAAVDFTHDASQDENCSTSNDNVLFFVEPVTGASYVARAFFPSSTKSTRNVLAAADAL